MISFDQVLALLECDDVRQSPIYQEAMQQARLRAWEEGWKEGLTEGRQQGRLEKLSFIPKLAARKVSNEDIAAVLEMEVELVRQVMAYLNAPFPDPVSDSSISQAHLDPSVKSPTRAEHTRARSRKSPRCRARAANIDQETPPQDRPQ
jgi:hypothetical protein